MMHSFSTKEEVMVELKDMVIRIWDMVRMDNTVIMEEETVGMDITKGGRVEITEKRDLEEGSGVMNRMAALLGLARATHGTILTLLEVPRERYLMMVMIIAETIKIPQTDIIQQEESQWTEILLIGVVKKENRSLK